MSYLLIILAATVLPGLFFVWLINYFDRFNREPANVIFKLFLAGLATPLPAVILEYILAPFISSTLINAFVGVAMPEEGVKLALILYFIKRNKSFDEILDGAVYAIAVSMGFAVTENIMYVFGSSNPFSLALIRSFTAIPLHALAAGFMGLAVARKKIESSGSVAGAYLTAVAIHGAYDYFLMEPLIPSFFSIILVIVLWIVLVKKIRKARRDDFIAGRFFHHDNG